MIILIPYKEQVDESDFKGFLDRNNLKKEDSRQDKIQQIMKDFANKSNIRVFDMMSYFKQQNSTYVA